MTDGETAREALARVALARLVADKHRPNGITLWCDAHRPDLEIAVMALGVPAVADSLLMAVSSLYAYVERHDVQRRDMRVHKAAVAPSPVPVTTEAVAPEAPDPRKGPEAQPLEKGIPYVLWTLALERGWSARLVAVLMSCRVKAVAQRTTADWEALARMYETMPSLLVDFNGKPLETGDGHAPGD